MSCKGDVQTDVPTSKGSNKISLEKKELKEGPDIQKFKIRRTKFIIEGKRLDTIETANLLISKGSIEDTVPLFLEEKKTGFTPLYPYAVYYGYYFYFIAIENTGILLSGKYSSCHYKLYYDNAHYLDDNRGSFIYSKNT